MFFFFDEEPVMNKPNTTNLEFIEIIGLFGRHDVKIYFENEVNIYIGENGLGKTTILNCVYYVLKKKYDKLADIDFNEIIIKFKYEQEFSITISDVIKYNRRMSRHRVYDDEEIFAIINDIFEGYNSDIFTMYENSIEEKTEIATHKLSRITHMPLTMCRQAVIEYIKTDRIRYTGKKGSYKNIEKLNELIDKHLKQRVIYLTTYRRIENDFTNLFRKDDDYLESDMLIRFGMSDVDKSIKSILNRIREDSRESFNKMTSVLLKQYSSPKEMENTFSSHYKIDMEMLKIILDRLGNEIAETDKELILSLSKSGRIYQINYSYLLNLIIKLIENYEKQKIYDEKIKKFVNTCNKYLNDKQFVYDQSELKLHVVLNTYNNEEERIELSKLSSGEKQIVSLFSKLYLENEKDSILIIDEPELSISMEWQRMLLPDIMRSDNCKLLLTVTHSPFIFENEFDTDAKMIRNCIDFRYGGR